MFFVVLIVGIAGLGALLCGADHILARFAVIASGLVGFAILSVLVIAVETILGMQKLGISGVLLGDAIVVGLLLLRAAQDKGLVRRLGKLWTPQ